MHRIAFALSCLLFVGCVTVTTPTPVPSPTPEPTPYASIGCITDDTLLYESAALDTVAFYSYTSGSSVHMERAKVQAGEPVILFDRTDTAGMVIVDQPPTRVGWVELGLIAPECQ